jgi:hypothetical protein
LIQPPGQHWYIQGGATPCKAPFGLHVSNSLSLTNTQALSIMNLGDGNCLWELHEYEVSAGIYFHKTAIAGFPLGEKQMIFFQMEALMGWHEFFSQDMGGCKLAP